MNKLVASIAAIAILLGAAPSQAAEKKLFNSERYRFDISYDADWKLAPATSRHHILTLDLPTVIEGVAERCYLAAVDDPPTGRWVDIGFPTSVTQLLRLIMPPPNLTRIDPTSISAGAATSFSTSFLQKTLTGEFPLIATGYLTALDNAVLVIGCNSVEGRKKDIRVALEKFASTLIRR